MTSAQTGASAPTLLVTGAQGFLGRHVAREWVRRFPRGRVVGVGRSPRSLTHFTHDLTIAGRLVRAVLPSELTVPAEGEGLEYRQLDVTDSRGMRALLADVAPVAVVHSAAALRDESFARLVTANVVSVVCVTAAAARASLRPRVILVSSGAVHGLPVDSQGPGWAPDPYTISKRAGEEVAAVEAALGALDVVIARVFNLVGAGLQDRHLPGRVALELEACRHAPDPELRLGSLDACRDLIDVADAARAVVAVAAADPGVIARLGGRDGVPAVDVGTGTAWRMRDVVEMQVRCAGLADRVRVLETAARAPGAPVLRADLEGLRQLDALPRTPLEQSLAAMAAYARSQS